MKHGILHSVAHNYADSMASGLGFVVGMFYTDVFAEAAANSEWTLTVDFLNGTADGAVVGGQVEAAVPLYKAKFPEFCEKHSIDHNDFKRLRVTFIASPISYEVVIEDRFGLASRRTYRGSPGKSDHKLDHLGRRRPKITFQKTRLSDST